MGRLRVDAKTLRPKTRSPILRSLAVAAAAHLVNRLFRVVEQRLIVETKRRLVPTIPREIKRRRALKVLAHFAKRAAHVLADVHR